MLLGELVYRYWLWIILYARAHICARAYFFLLCGIEQCYKLVFFCSRAAFFYWRSPYDPSFPIISVGNISCGGVGKSVFTRYVLTSLVNLNGGVITRGYRGSIEKEGRNALLSDGKNLFCNVTESGDEAMMYALMHSVPVVLGGNRAISAQKIYDIDYAVLDDSYQNGLLEKSYEILLLDARAPFSNNHCLPAGLLREKDILRANSIVLTHADAISVSSLSLIKKKIRKKGFTGFIGAGRHKPFAVVKSNFSVSYGFNKKQQVGAFAGVGSFSGFLHTLRKAEIFPRYSQEFPNHFFYTKKEVNNIYTTALHRGVTACITTLKDLVKIHSLWPADGSVFLYALDVNFEFLDKNDEVVFLKILKNSIERKMKH